MVVVVFSFVILGVGKGLSNHYLAFFEPYSSFMIFCTLIRHLASNAIQSIQVAAEYIKNYVDYKHRDDG